MAGCKFGQFIGIVNKWELQKVAAKARHSRDRRISGNHVSKG